MMKVRIAHLNVAIDSIDKPFFNYRFREYENNEFINPDMTLRSIAVDEIKYPQGEILQQIRDATIMRIADNYYCRYLTNRETGEIFSATYYNDTYSEVEIQILKTMPQESFSLTDYEYMYTGFAFSDRLTRLGGAVLHGSSIAYDSQGIVFSANSGTGKSTHTSLWKENFGSKVIFVNDDKPAILFYDGIPYIFGTPWSGKSDLNANVKIPLKAVIFIKRSEENRIERLNTRDSIFNFMNQIARPYYDENIGLLTIDIIERLVQTVPIYMLYCDISQAAVDTVYKQLVKEGVIDA